MLIVDDSAVVRQFLEESRIRICDAVKAAYLTKLKKPAPGKLQPVQAKLTADVILPLERIAGYLPGVKKR